MDGLHEDLNKIIKKPIVDQKDYDGRSDEIVSNESWFNSILIIKIINSHIFNIKFV